MGSDEHGAVAAWTPVAAAWVECLPEPVLVLDLGGPPPALRGGPFLAHAALLPGQPPRVLVSIFRPGEPASLLAALGPEHLPAAREAVAALGVSNSKGG